MDTQKPNVDFGVSKEINEHILTQALESYTSCIKRGMEHKAAIDHIKEEFDLTLSEYKELVKRLDEQKSVNIATGEKGETVATRGNHVVFKDEKGKTSTVPRKHIRNECIYFEDAQQAEQAIGMLMYKGVPWQARGSEDNGHYIQFDNKDNLDRAFSALTRRWDFVDREPKRVAVVEFDNLDDYEKVIDFMSKQGMVVEYGGEYELEEDLNYRYKKGQPSRIKKLGKNNKLHHLSIQKSTNPDAMRALQAKQRQTGEIGAFESIAEEKEKRVCRIRRKWKPSKED